MIKISIIVPVYNVPLKYLRECFNSLSAQTMQESEFIVVSDGAPDAECSICQEYANKDNRFKFFKREHAGVSATRNYGIEQAQGEYITFVDSDDWISPTNCEEVYNFARKHASDIVVWEVQRFGNVRKKTRFYKNEPIGVINSIDIQDICNNIIFTSSENFSIFSLVCCKLFKKTLIQTNNLKYPNDISFNEDRLFNIFAFKLAKKISYLNKIFYFYRIHNQSTSHTFTCNAFQEYIKFLKNTSLINSTKSYKKNISHEYIRSFFLSWATDYFHPTNKANFKKNIQHLKHIIVSQEFQQHLKFISAVNFPFLIRIEIFLFKKQYTFPLYLHYFKALLKSSFLQFHS